MVVRTGRLSRVSVSNRLDLWQLLAVALVVWMLALVVGQSAGRLSIAQATVYLVLPIVAFGALVRPAWVVLLIAASPIGLIEPGRMRPLILLMLLTLAGQLLQRGSLSVGPASGFLAFAGLVAAAFVFRIDLTGDSASFARGSFNIFVFVLLLGWLSYNVTRSGDLKGKRLADALLLGLAVTMVLGIALSLSVPGLSGPGTQALGRAAAGYIAAMGFLLSFARLLIATDAQSVHGRVTHLALTLLFAIGMSLGLLRGAWLSALIGMFFIALWAGKRKYLLIVPAALVLVLAVPVARERVVPSENVAVTGEASLISYTTGRWDLWTRLWDEIEIGLPLGHGFGHAFTLSSEDLFGPASSSFAVRDANTPFVYPHNDFLFWMVDLGLLGLFGMILFWTQILRAFRAVSRSGTEYASHVRVLSGVLITTLVAQIVANTFSALAIAARFFIVAGFVFGVRQWIKRGHALGTEAAVAVPRSVGDSG